MDYINFIHQFFITMVETLKYNELSEDFQGDLDLLKWEIEWEDEKHENEKINENPRKLHWQIQIWKVVIPDYADIASSNATSLICVDASHEKTWLWVTVVRIDDFSKDPSNPVSQATVINPHWEKSLGKASISLNSEFAFIDKMPEWNGLTTKIAWSYNPWKGWNFEWAYFHWFNKWPDLDSFRATIEKKVNDALTLTAQWRYKSDYDKKFFGRAIADINLWNGFWVQLSCIRRDWKLEPTGWICYKF